MIYVASPYTHPDPKIQQLRFEQVCQATAYLLCQGKLAFSPIVHGHPLTRYKLPGDWGFWQAFGETLLGLSSEMMILTLDGWKESIGVQAEIKIAERLGKQISYISFEEIQI